jgi:hypothetical protein
MAHRRHQASRRGVAQRAQLTPGRLRPGQIAQHLGSALSYDPVPPLVTNYASIPRSTTAFPLYLEDLPTLLSSAVKPLNTT